MENTHGRQPSFAFAWGAGVAAVVVVVAGETLPTVDLFFIRLAGVALLLMSPTLWIPPFVHLTNEGAPTPGMSYGDTTRVVRTGLYGIVRHPQYLGYCVLTLGFVLIGLNTVSTAAGLLALLAFNLQARTEERFLTAHRGEAYADYVRAVPRFNFLLGIARKLRRYS